MRLRRRKKDRRYGCTTIGSGGYTLIETVVSLAIFVIAATVFYMIFQHAAASYEDQCRMELAGEICRDARRKIDWRLRNARYFWVNGREAGRLYLQEEEDGGWEILTADDFQPDLEEMEIELDFSGTEEGRLEAEIRVWGPKGRSGGKEILASRRLSQDAWGNWNEKY